MGYAALNSNVGHKPVDSPCIDEGQCRHINIYSYT